jgi:hypothetical protein
LIRSAVASVSLNHDDVVARGERHRDARKQRPRTNPVARIVVGGELDSDYVVQPCVQCDNDHAWFELMTTCIITTVDNGGNCNGGEGDHDGGITGGTLSDSVVF